MSFISVSPKEIKQWLQTVFITEHTRRKVTVEKLNTIANRWRPVGARKSCIEWLKIELKHKYVIKPNNWVQTKKS